MTRPLDGVRILDLTNVLAGPFCAYQLALVGAEVIKVERPGSGDLARRLGADPDLIERGMGSSYLAQNAGKRSLTLDLKAAAGRDAFLRLAATADVVVENFRPGVMDRLGLGHDALQAVRADIIYCAISGFGQDGPMRDNPAYDQIVQGLSGAMAVTGDAAGGPLRVGFPVSDTVGGLTASFAITAALFRRAQTGAGAFIDVSMLEATMAAMGWVVSNHLIAGQAPTPMGNDNFTASPSGAFRTADGLLNIAANQQAQYESLCRVLDRPDLIADSRFATRAARLEHRAALTTALEDALATRPAADWESVLNDAGVPAGRVLTLPEAFAQPQVAARGTVRTFPDVPGTARDVAVVGAGFRLTDGDPAVETPPPTLGEHSTEILSELGYSASEIAALRDEGVI